MFCPRSIGVLKVVAPIRADSFLATNVPYVPRLRFKPLKLQLETIVNDPKTTSKGISTRNQTSFSLKPSWTMLLILKPCVGIVWVMSSEVKVFRMVVFPALSKPRTRIRASISSWSCSGYESMIGSLVDAYCQYCEYVDVICSFHVHTNLKTVFVWEPISLNSCGESRDILANVQYSG